MIFKGIYINVALKIKYFKLPKCFLNQEIRFILIKENDKTCPMN